MYLIHILLPLCDNKRQPFTEALMQRFQKELCNRFGGLTAYNRAPAEGAWGAGALADKDDILVIDIMADDLDADWWHTFRKRAENAFDQEELVFHAHEIRRL